MPNGNKHKRHKMSTHKRKKRLRKDRHKKKSALLAPKRHNNTALGKTIVVLLFFKQHVNPKVKHYV